MSRQPRHHGKNLFWITFISLSLFLTPCNRTAPPPPTDIPLESKVSQLQANQTLLAAGQQTDIRAAVVKVVGGDTPFEFQWEMNGGFITYGQGTCCITYQAPDVPGTYEVKLTVRYGPELVQRAITLQVTAATPTVVLTPTPIEPTPTSTRVIEENALTNANAYFERAQVSYIKRDYEQTIADYTKAIEMNYDPLSQPYYNRGYVYYVQRNYPQAINDFTKAIEFNYEPISLVYYNRGNAYYYQGMNDLAINDYTKAIELKHEPLSWLYNSRGLAYRKRGDYELAIADYTKAIELNHDPLNWPYYNRGNAYADKGAYEQAIADYNQAISFDPSSADAYYQRGLTYRKIGNTSQAVNDFNKVLELGNDFWRQEAEKQLQELAGQP